MISVKLDLLHLLGKIAPFFSQLGLSVVNRTIASLLKHTLTERLVVQVDGLRLQSSFEGWSLLHAVKNGTFEPFTVDLFKETVKPGMVVLDIGAQMGLYTLLAARRVGIEGKVYAFEPDPRSRADLAINIEANNIQSVTIVPKAVSDQNAVHSFYLRRTPGLSGFYESASRDPIMSRISVDCVTVDEFIGSGPVDVVKMDIEGGEAMALKGMRRTLRNNPQLQLFVECNPPILHAAGIPVGEFLSGLNSEFNHVLVIDEDGRRLVPATESLLANKHNLLCHGVKA